MVAPTILKARMKGALMGQEDEEGMMMTQMTTQGLQDLRDSGPLFLNQDLPHQMRASMNTNTENLMGGNLALLSLVLVAVLSTGVFHGCDLLAAHLGTVHRAAAKSSSGTIPPT